MNIGVAVITYKSKRHLQHCLPPLVNSPLKPQVLVVDAESNDGTFEEAFAQGASFLSVPYHSYNHGKTREQARKALGTDIVVMVTPDAYAVDATVLEKLVAPLQEKRAALAYARQLPRKGASFFEAFPRKFNYPATSHSRGEEDRNKYGSYINFFSDSFGAYLNAALDEIGGFQEVLLGEDAIACAELLARGYKCAYVANACVHHSHAYSLKAEFQRHFDTGMARRSFTELLGDDGQRGRAYVKQLFIELIKEKPHYLPYGIAHILAKYTGYQLGVRGDKFPIWLKRNLSSQKFYWD